MFDEDAADIDEVLSSMAESLVEGQAFYKVPQLPDADPSPLKAIRPSKDIFYRTLPLYTKNPPGNVAQRRCSCMYLCTGAVATIKCISCASMDVQGVGYFCQVCFNARHPWYRVPHVYVDIEDDEDVLYNRKTANFRMEMLRCEHEGQDLLKRIEKQKSKLDHIGDDANFDDTLRTAGRAAMNVESKLRLLRRKLRVDIRTKDSDYKTRFENEARKNEIDAMDNIYAKSSISSTCNKNDRINITREQYIQEQLLKPIDLPVNIDEAVAIIQKYFRGWLMRKLISLLYCSKIITKIYDDTQQRFYYFNKVNGSSRWNPPSFVMSEHMQYIAINASDEDNNQNVNPVEHVSLRLTNKNDTQKVYKPQMNSAKLVYKKPLWCCKLIRLGKRRKRKVITDIYKAGIVIQQFFKCILARKKVVSIANQQYIRVWDNDTFSYYYYNTVSKTSNWRKPVGIYLYNSIEPPDANDK